MRSHKKDILRCVAGGISFDQSSRKHVIEKFIKDSIEFESEVMRIFGGDFSIVWEWLNAPAVAFNGARPIDLSATGNIDILRQHIVRLEYCVYT